MYFANPLGLLGLLAVPAVLFIHLFQRRFPPLSVGGLHLWLGDETVQTAGQRKDRIPLTRTLILEVIAATLLGLLLAQPRIADDAPAAHWIFVLDDSASMEGRLNEDTIRDRALAEITRRMEASGDQARLTVLITGSRPSMLAGPAVTLSEALPALESWQPRAMQHPFQPSWDMAQQLAGLSGSPVFLTDTVPAQTVPRRLEVVALGQPLPNLAFETARWLIDPDSLQGTIYFRVHNHAESPARGFLVGRDGDRELFRESLSLAARGTSALSLDVMPTVEALQVQLESADDALPLDSSLVLRRPPPNRVRVYSALDPDSVAAESVARMVTLSSTVVPVSDPADADLVIVPAGSDFRSEDRRQWTLELGPLLDQEPDDGGVAESGSSDDAENAQRRSVVGPFLAERHHRLMEGVTVQGVVWTHGVGAVPGLSPLLSVDQTVLIGQREPSLSPHYIVNLDMQRSNWHNTPDWPVFMSNVFAAVGDSRPGLHRANFQISEIVRFPVDPQSVDLESEKPLVLRQGASERQLVRGRLVETMPLDRTGVFEILDDDRLIATFAVNYFDPRESDLTQLSEGAIPADVVASETLRLEASSGWLVAVLLTLLGLIAAMNWFWLRQERLAESPAMGVGS